MKNLFVILFLLVFTTTFSQELEKRQVKPAQVDAVFSRWDSPNKPGIAVGILVDGKIVYTQGYGLANLEHRIPISPETRFHIGDLAKEFTVYALLLLEQRGQLSLADDIRDHMPELMPFPHSIRISQLIHHTGGLNNAEVFKALAGWRPEDVYTRKQAYSMIQSQAKSTTDSRVVQRFSDAGFMVLEDLIAKVSKMSYPDFVTQEIFEPLGMTNSVFDNGAVIPRKAQGYYAQGDGFASSRVNHTHTLLSDLYTTVGDMCLWAKELGNPKLGTARMVQKFDKLSMVDGKTVAEGNRALYTGGHRFWNFRGAKKLYHTEVAGGYASKLIRYPDYDLAVVIMGNDGAYNGYAGTSASALYIEDYLDAPSTESLEIASKKLSNKQLSAYIGSYWDVANYSTRNILITNDTLRYSRGSGNESALIPLTKNRFQMIAPGEVFVRFDTNAVPPTMSVAVGENSFHLEAYNPKADWVKDLHSFTGEYQASTLDTSYELGIHEGTLVLRHSRLEPVHLSPRIPNVFTGDRRHFEALTFKRGPNGEISGFLLSAHGVEDIWFQRKMDSQKDPVKTK